MSKLQRKWHDMWLVDTLLRVGFLVLVTWIALTIAVYLTGAGEPLCIAPGPCEPVPPDPPAGDLP
ncbi:MAG: hypothetical protein ABI670_11435 [Chloroflexota bacterium]